LSARLVVLLALAACGQSAPAPPQLFSEPPDSPRQALADPRAFFGRVVDVDLRALESGSFQMRIASDVTLSVKRNRLVRITNGLDLIAQSPQGAAVFVVDGQSLTATVRTQDAVYEILPSLGRRHLIVKREWRAFVGAHPPEFEQLRRRPGPRALPLPSPRPLLFPIVRVMFVATRELGLSLAEIRSRAQVALDEANIANRDSGVRFRFELADVMIDDAYVEQDDLHLDRLAFERDGDGDLDAVHRRRRQVKADLAVLLVACSGCSPSQSGYSPVMATKQTAFTAIVYSSLAYLTLPHELGHLMGLRHERPNDTETLPYADGHGYAFAGQWRSVMATGSACTAVAPCERKPRWSSPTLFGTPDDANCARALDASASGVASFY
jgi:peptidyl-Asp metalloendopeptidase